MSYFTLSRIYAEEFEKQLARQQSTLRPVSLCIHPDCPVCKAQEAEQKKQLEVIKKEQAKKKAEYRKRCEKWLAKIHKIIEVGE